MYSTVTFEASTGTPMSTIKRSNTGQMVGLFGSG